jgi:anti-anti-sigma factor
MKVKIDTKEKFHVITPLEANISANLTENINDLMHGFLEKEVKNVVFNVAQVQSMDEVIADSIAALHKAFYAQNASFVICTLTPGVENLLGSKGYLDILNITPTESEAWDIVQMEEIEREIFGEEREE